MPRRTSRISHDEVRRLVKAVQSCGLAVGKVVFDGIAISIVIGGDNGDIAAASVDAAIEPENCSSIDEYRAWRDRERAGGRS